MDYLLFDLLAVAVPAALLLVRARGRRQALLPVAVLAAVAVAWTAPWDGLLVRTGVWSYDPHAVLGQVGSVPVEEFGFVVLEVVLVAAWRLRTPRWSVPADPALPTVATPAGALGWLALGVAGAVLLLWGGHLRYLGLLLVWVAPAFAFQHAIAHDVLAAQRKSRLLRVAPVALWLCVCDRLALARGIWTIGPVSATGVTVGGLPVEEALFFWLTCLLSADGLLLATHPAVLRRVRKLLTRPAAGLRAAAVQVGL